MQVDGNENIPFSLFISSQRRRKIMQSIMSKAEKEKRDGEKILNNYKKQLAEKLAREQVETVGGVKSQNTSRLGASSGMKSERNGETEAMKLVSQKLMEISSFQGEPPDPEILLSILNKKSIV